MKNLIFESGDYLAHVDEEIIVVWKRNDVIFAYNCEGEEIYRSRESWIEDLEDADRAAAEFVEVYYENPHSWGVDRATRNEKELQTCWKKQ